LGQYRGRKDAQSGAVARVDGVDQCLSARVGDVCIEA